MMLTKIISGGQTGADQGGLEAGRELGLETGGTAPLSWKTERGPMRELLQSYGLVEAGVPGYPFRTEMNVLNSSGTVVFGGISQAARGSLLTLNLCRRFDKPCIHLYLSDVEVEKFLLLEWLGKYNVQVLNVAGNRESRNLGIRERVREFMVRALEELKND